MPKTTDHLIHYRIPVVVPSPAHSSMDAVLTYTCETPIPAGSLLRVPLGKGGRQVLALSWGDAQVQVAPGSHSASVATENATRASDMPPTVADASLKPIAQVFADLPPLPRPWRELIAFTAQYYQRSVGEVALAALPPQLRQLDDAQMLRKLRPKPTSRMTHAQTAGNDTSARTHTLSPEQDAALAQLTAPNPDRKPFLLFGATGSGKTEVYLRRIETLFQQDPLAQALVLVPEINLTPQLLARFMQRIDTQFGVGATVLLHSALSPAKRVQSWLSAHQGRARLVLGTRLAVLASLPHLRLVVVDEEHDPSYKSQDGARYSARDLAVYRGKKENAQVILGSATPALESWHHAQTGRYQLVPMPSRVGAAALPKVHLIDLRTQPKGAVISPVLQEALLACLARGEQALLFLNRRGYAPVLVCSACDWKSDCPHCSAHQVFHKIDRSLRCHHCGYGQAVPRSCPQCGNLDIATQGRGTEQLEELLVQHLAQVQIHKQDRDGQAVRVARIDADTAKGVGALEAQLAQVHAGEVDVLVGTQMITKGHDFRRVGLVAAINPDSALFAGDFRASERLFSLLLQAAGRAGRDASAVTQAGMWVQTHHPSHALYQALCRHDFPAFASSLLQERKAAVMPPFVFQALLRAEAQTQAAAQDFLNQAADLAQAMLDDPIDAAPTLAPVTLYPAIPMSMQRIANIERAQMLVESASRPALQHLLGRWQGALKRLKIKGVIRWAVDVDPLSI